MIFKKMIRCFFIIAFCLLARHASAQGIDNTIGCRLDLGFIMDRSGSIQIQNWQIALEFVANFTGIPVIGEEATRVGVVTFNRDATLDIQLHDYYHRHELQNAIRSLPYSGGGTDIADGIAKARTQLFQEINGDRSSAPNIAVLMTDGNSDAYSAIAEADRMRETGASFIVIGIGGGINRPTLEAIAGDPDMVFYVADFESLYDDLAEMIRKSCEAAKFCADGQFETWNNSYPALDSCPQLSNPVVEDSKYMKFYCTLNYSAESIPNLPDARFEVTFLFDSRPAVDVPPVTLQTPESAVELHEKHLWGKLGKYISCKVHTWWIASPTLRSPPVYSRSYWAGISFSHETIDLFEEDDGPRSIYLYSTLPAVCFDDNDSSDGCELALDVSSGTTAVAVFQYVNGLARPCTYVFTDANWKQNESFSYVTGEPLQILAQRDQIQGEQRQDIIVVRARNIETKKLDENGVSYWHPFNDYILGNISVSIHDGDPADCSSTGDPRITTFDGVYYTAPQVGTFTYVKSSSSRDFEIQVRHFPCRTWSTSCSIACGVAVKEGTETQIISACDESGDVHILHCDENSSGSITADPARRTYMISTPGGAQVKASILSRGMNLLITVPARDRGKTQGLCGTFDHDTSNEFVKRGEAGLTVGTHQTETFVESWKVNSATNLFTCGVQVQLYNPCGARPPGLPVPPGGMPSNPNCPITTAIPAETTEISTMDITQTGPQGPVTTASKSSTAQVITTTTNALPATTRPPSITTTPPQLTTAAPPQPTTATPQPPTTAAPPQPTTTTPPQPTTATLPQPTTATPPQPTTTTPPQPTTTTPPQPTTATPPQPTTATPPQPTTAAPPQPTTATPPQPTTATPPQPTTATPPSPTTAPPPQPTTAPTPPPTTTAPPPPITTTPLPPTTATPPPPTSAPMPPPTTTTAPPPTTTTPPPPTTTTPPQPTTATPPPPTTATPPPTMTTWPPTTAPPTPPQPLPEDICNCKNSDTDNAVFNLTALCGFDALEHPLNGYANPEEIVRALIPAFLKNNAGARRRRRSLSLDTDDENPLRSDDYDEDYYIFYYTETYEGEDTPPDWSEWNTTETEARNHCSDVLTLSEVYSSCGNTVVLPDRRDGIVTKCVDDIQRTGDFSWAYDKLFEFQGVCLRQILNNTHVTNRENPLSDPLLGSQMDDFARKICPSNCSGHGECVNTTCHCVPGFVGADCSVPEGTPPTLTAYHGYNICDIQDRPCLNVRVKAEYVVNSNQLSCHVKINQQNGGSTAYTQPGELHSASSVICPLLDLLTLDLGNVNRDTDPVYEYEVTLSNNGVNKSDPLWWQPRRVLDSTCMDCTSGACLQKEDTCVIDGQCYLSGDMKGTCLSCLPNVDSRAWTSSGNAEGSPPSYESSPLYMKTPEETLDLNLEASEPNVTFKLVHPTDREEISISSTGRFTWGVSAENEPSLEITIEITGKCYLSENSTVNLVTLDCLNICGLHANCIPEEPRGEGHYSCECLGGYTGEYCDVPPSNTWSEWSAFGNCSKNCDYGLRSRTKVCLSEPCYGAAPAEHTVCNDFNCPEKESEKNHGAVIIVKSSGISKVVEIEKGMETLSSGILHDFCLEFPSDCCSAVGLRYVDDTEITEAFFDDVSCSVANSYPRIKSPDIHVKMLAQIDVTTVSSVCVSSSSSAGGRQSRQSQDIRNIDKDIIIEALAGSTYKFSEAFGIEVQIDDTEETDEKSYMLKYIVAPVAAVGAVILIVVVLVSVLVARKRKQSHQEDGDDNLMKNDNKDISQTHVEHATQNHYSSTPKHSTSQASNPYSEVNQHGHRSSAAHGGQPGLQELAVPSLVTPSGHLPQGPLTSSVGRRTRSTYLPDQPSGYANESFQASPADHEESLRAMALLSKNNPGLLPYGHPRRLQRQQVERGAGGGRNRMNDGTRGQPNEDWRSRFIPGRYGNRH